MNATFPLPSSWVRKGLAGIALAVAFVAPSSAAFIYSLDVRSDIFGGHGDFVLTVDNFITANTSFALSDFDSIDPLPGTTSMTFSSLVTSPLITYEGTGTSLFWTSSNAFTGPGVYCAGGGDCSDTAAVMTIREIADVPEPGTLALAALALGAVGAARRRRQ